MKGKVVNILIIILLIIGFSLLVVSSLGISEQVAIKNEYNQNREEVIIKEKNEINYDFFKKKYPDAIAWLEIPDTPISYPIMQDTSQNYFYLSHNERGEYSQYGAIFTDPRHKNNPFDDKNTIIYGHNMGTWSNLMFSDLKKFESQNYFNEHQTVYIFVNGNKREFYVICVSKSDELSSIYDINPEDLKIWVENQCEKSIYKNKVVKDINKVVTLSTCSNSRDGKKLTVLLVEK